MILESSKRKWTDPYGNQEEYSWKEVRVSKSAHLWHGSAMETDDSCGNCDGANCNSCTDVYTVIELSEPQPHYGEWGYDYNQVYTLGCRRFETKKEAMDYYKSLK